MSVRDQLRELFFAHGGEGEISEKTIDTLEYLAREYVRDLVVVIDEAADYNGGSINDEVVLLGLLLDHPKFKRAKEMISNSKSVDKGSVFSLSTF